MSDDDKKEDKNILDEIGENAGKEIDKIVAKQNEKIEEKKEEE